jgi:DNA-binding ferritin-like protein
MAEPTQPLSIRLATTDIDHLAERARRISGTPTGVARELIRAGLTDGDPFTQAERLLKIERRLAAIGQDVQAVLTITTAQSEAATRVETMFEDLLRALSGQPLK